MGKPAFVTNTKPTRTKDTIRAYLKGGFVLLARAHKTMTGPGGDVIDAFRALFGDTDLVYRPATTRLYQQQVKAVIARQLSDRELSKERAKSGFAEIKALLIARRGPCPKRTSSAKLKSASCAEFRKIAARLCPTVASTGRARPNGHSPVHAGQSWPLRWIAAMRDGYTPLIVGRNLNVLNAEDRQRARARPSAGHWP